jgi:PAS domain S-box-containing protein
MVAFAAAITLILVLAGLGVRALERSGAMADSVQHTYQVLNQVNLVSAGLSEVLRRAQAYVITGDESYLAQREQALSDVASSLRDLQDLTVDNPSQQARVAELNRAVSERLEIINDVVATRQSDGLVAAQSLYAARSPQAVMERLHAQQLAVVHEEQRLLEQRKLAERESRRRLMMLAGALIAVVIVTVVSGLAWLRRELAVRRRLARTFEAQQRFLESVLEHIPALVYVKDPISLQFVSMNRATEAWFGRSRETLIGRSVTDLLTPDEADVVTVSDKEALRRHGVLDIPQNSRVAPDGTRTIFRTLKSAVRDKGGQPLFLLCISLDISDKVADEQRIQALNEYLEEQKTALEASNKELESFSYSVSHDLRAPLRAIDGFSLMLLEDYGPKLDHEAQRYLATIRAGSQRMGQLIDDLLAFSRLGRQPLRAQTIDMDKIVREATKEALGAVTGSAPRLTIHPLPPAVGDPTLLEHVWGNLLGNAVKYSSKVANPAIEIGARQDGGETVYFVRDNGAGFDMQYASKLFGVFQRLHGQDEFPGTGVGLAIVHRIVTRHGGRVWANSAPGRGATFQFCLPGAVSS